MNTLLLLLILPLAQTAPTAPALSAAQRRELQLAQLEKAFPVLLHVEKQEKTAWFARQGDAFALRRQLAALETAREDVAHFVVARGLDETATDEALWLAYNLASSVAHKDGGGPALDRENLLKSLEERAGLLAITTTPAGCKVFVDGIPAAQLSNHRRFVAAGPRKIRVEKTGFKTVTQEIAIEPGGTHAFTTTLERTP